ncbi:MAG: hypothetical protein WC953_11645, partial [Pseudomonas sp.]
NAHPPGQANLDVGAFFDTQFKVRHGDTIPEWSGVALSSCGRRVYADWLTASFLMIRNNALVP